MSTTREEKIKQLDDTIAKLSFRFDRLARRLQKARSKRSQLQAQAKLEKLRKPMAPDVQKFADEKAQRAASRKAAALARLNGTASRMPLSGRAALDFIRQE